MFLSRPILVFSLLFVCCPLPARSQGSVATVPGSDEPAHDYEYSLQGLRWQLQDVLNAARSDNRPRLESLVRQMEIPGYKEWFPRTFGQEKGESWAEAYGNQLGENEKQLEDTLTRLAGEDGEFSTRTVNGAPQPARAIEARLIGELKRPTGIYFVSWRELGSPRGSESSPVGYFVFLDGRFRWDSAVDSSELQPDPAYVNAAPQAQPKSQLSDDSAELQASDRDKGIFRVGVDGIRPPSCTSCPDPKYSKLARDRQLNGTVVLQGIVQVDGEITDLHDLKSPDPELTKIAIDGVRQWHLKPAHWPDGDAVPVRIHFEVTFRLAKYRDP